jgi:hypothetical protein
LGAGSHSFDVRATDAAGNTDASPASRTWTVDTSAPDTTLQSTPTNPTSSTNASFAFASTEAGSTFECSLDGAAFAPCTSPDAHASLSEGTHTFDVRATDPAGNPDPTPASHTWSVDTTTPDTTVDSGPADPTSETSATFVFSSSEGASTFECSVDGASLASCASPALYTGLTAGSHTFDVRATDAAGNVDPSPATYLWNVE